MIGHPSRYKQQERDIDTCGDLILSAMQPWQIASALTEITKGIDRPKPNRHLHGINILVTMLVFHHWKALNKK